MVNTEREAHGVGQNEKVMRPAVAVLVFGNHHEMNHVASKNYSACPFPLCGQ
jgi:hypothetical protein